VLEPLGHGKRLNRPAGLAGRHEGEVDCTLGGAVSIASMAPSLDEGAVVLDVKGAVHAVRVGAKRGEAITGEVLDLIDLDDQFLGWHYEVEAGIGAGTLRCEKLLIASELTMQLAQL
jgi:hypothetical protein